ncbi:glycosyltransferase family 2 protein [Flavobacterium saccharophilum]|uniref:Glycosyltransferase, GT2 family n=1 Tax=Flavobacterium saccharophilum TaxID=29534 RepID=A0A1M7GUM0_9FLAO|nr:glycosyltransferase family A protein [Flavobacterium saccharophilum]SHM19539.1 Glycosyltransferase, GT2 family [Flavobacterium saccharophilum]
MSSPLISVIIPLYNKEDSILDTVKSVLNQTFQDFELLIVDDGSTDKSLTLLSNYKDSRITIISKENGGVSAARNYGVEASNAEYVFFLDADDIITKDCLSLFFEMLKKKPGISFFVANFKKTFEDGKEEIYSKLKIEGIVKDPIKNLWKKNIFPRTGSMLIKKECFSNIGGAFKTEISIYEDLELILRLMNNYQVYYSPKVVLLYQCEYNTLSKSIGLLSKEWIYYLKDIGVGFYEKMITAENVYNIYQKCKSQKDYESMKFIKVKFRRYFIYILLSIFDRKKMNILNKFRSWL